MEEQWEQDLSCASSCSRCNAGLSADDRRILSVYSHEPICMECKKQEENRPDYEETSRNMIGQCMADTEAAWSDPGGYCFYHFYPFKCS
ncbi:MAG: hypothetical protein ACQETG_02460 [Thermodesulfobacteriota bacterium]